jgi:hypothetical protein
LELRNSALFLAGVVGSSISIMLKKVFRKPKSVDTSSTLTTLNQLNEILEMLEKKEKLWQRKIAAEVTKAREYTQAKNKKAAIQCLKRKKLYEVQVEQLGNYQLRLHDQVSPPSLITLVSLIALKKPCPPVREYCDFVVNCSQRQLYILVQQNS